VDPATQEVQREQGAVPDVVVLYLPAAQLRHVDPEQYLPATQVAHASCLPGIYCAGVLVVTFVSL
jgi:hypothetical protein